LDGFLVAQIVVAYGFEIFIQLVDQRDGRGDVELDNLFFGNIVQVFDQGAQAVAVRGDQYFFSGFYRRGNGFMPVGQKAVDRIFSNTR
jgi:hypothetical protein